MVYNFPALVAGLKTYGFGGYLSAQKVFAIKSESPVFRPLGKKKEGGNLMKVKVTTSNNRARFFIRIGNVTITIEIPYGRLP